MNGCSHPASYMLHTGPMGFADDAVGAIRKAKEKTFRGVVRRFAEAANYDPTNLGRYIKGEKGKWLESFGRLMDAAGVKLVERDAWSTAEAANRDLKRMPGKLAAELTAAAEGLSNDPRPRNAEHITDSKPKAYKIRRGDYRIVYEVDDAAAKVRVIRFANRREVYLPRRR